MGEKKKKISDDVEPVDNFIMEKTRPENVFLRKPSLSQ